MSVAAPVMAEDAPPVVQTYDVATIVRVHPPHPLVNSSVSGNPFGGAGSGGEQLATQLLEASVRRSLSKFGFVVTDKNVTVDNDEATVLAPPAGQAVVRQLLDALRVKAETQVRVEAVWVIAAAAVPETRAAALLADREAVCYRSSVTGFNLQTVSSQAVHEIAVVTGATPVVAPGVKMNQYSTEVDRPGISLEVTPRLQNDHSVEVNVEAELSSESPSNATTQPATRTDDAPVLRPERSIQSVHTTVALTSGEPTIVAGLSSNIAHGPVEMRYLVMTATIIPPPPAPAKLFK